MREDQLGIGYIAAVPGRGRGDGEPAGVGKRRMAVGERDGGAVVRGGIVELGRGKQRGRVRIGEHDDIWRRGGTEVVQWGGADGTYRLREDDVGIGHGVAMPGRRGLAREPACTNERGSGWG